MKFSATILALAGAAAAASVDPASASLALFSVLPSSLQAIAITNPAEAATIISSEFKTGTPSWFTSLPTAVQSYFVTAGGSAPATTGLANSTIVSIAKNSTVTPGSNSTITYATATLSAAGTAAASTSALSTISGKAGSSSSTGGASMPTQVVGAGIAGALGLIGMLAL